MKKMEQMKKMISRHKVVWMALGRVFSGSLASPAVIPISSVPEKAKLTVSIVVKTPPKPVGNQPSLVRLVKPGAPWLPFKGITPTTASPPKMMKATIAATLTAANQNSLSAKILTEKKLERKIKIMKTRLQIQTGTEGNQCRMIIPAAVNSLPRAIVQVSQ